MREKIKEPKKKKLCPYSVVSCNYYQLLFTECKLDEEGKEALSEVKMYFFMISQVFNYLYQYLTRPQTPVLWLACCYLPYFQDIEIEERPCSVPQSIEIEEQPCSVPENIFQIDDRPCSVPNLEERPCSVPVNGYFCPELDSPMMPGMTLKC